MKYFLVFTLILFNLSIFAVNYDVKMLNQNASGVMVFEPAVLRINVGDTVTFKSIDAAHNSASIPGMIPAGAIPWNSELSKDLTVSFDVAGIYGYQCTPHSMMAMVGVIEVGNDQSNLSQVKSIAQTFKSTFVMNLTRLDDYLSQIN
tara:strand:+ start:100 stop:540 length:441 start_codon:yes stop_codon:yes gene_type:complete